MKEVSSLPEIWDVYDENRVKKPYTHVRGVPLDKGDWHLVVETWVVTQDNRVLLTLRDPNKHYGNLWECTGGSALSGEDSITAIHRELREETGLDMGNVQPTLLCTTLHHNSIVDTYAIRLNFTLSDLVLQPGETVDAKFVDFSALEDSSCESWLPEPIAYRLRTALPLLKRFLDGAECTDMYSLDGHPLGYSRLRLCDGAAPQFPRETCLVPLLFLMSEEGRILLTQRAAGRAAEGEWALTGGGLRPGETPEQGMRREAREEIGLSLPSLSEVGRLLLGEETAHWCMVLFACRMPFALADLRVDPAEVSDAKLVEPEELSQFPMVRGILDKNPALYPALCRLREQKA